MEVNLSLCALSFCFMCFIPCNFCALCFILIPFSPCFWAMIYAPVTYCLLAEGQGNFVITNARAGGRGKDDVTQPSLYIYFLYHRCAIYPYPRSRTCFMNQRQGNLRHMSGSSFKCVPHAMFSSNSCCLIFVCLLPCLYTS